MADAAGDAPRVGRDVFVGVVCPLLVIAWSADDQPARDGGQGGPGADPTNRCGASDPPASLSMTQQRLVCLDAAHVDCPRFVRAMGPGRGGSGRLARSASARGGSSTGAGSASTGRADRSSAPDEASGAGASAGVAAGLSGAAVSVAGPAADIARAGPEPAATPVRGAAVEAAPAPVERLAPIVPVAPHVRSSRRSGARPARSRPGPLVVAGGILVAALIVALAFTSIRGGLSLPGGAPGLGTASPNPSAAVSPSPTLAPSPTPTAAPTPSPTPSPLPSPSVAASPSGTPQPSLPPAFVGLKPCTDAPDCYLYRVRSGDNLTQIAQHFGVTKTAIKSLNPEITDPSLIHVGDMIRIPLPTG